VNPDMQLAIQRLITQFLATPPPAHAWAVDAVRAHDFLPLYFGWVATLGIRPDGSMLRWHQEEGVDAVGTLDVEYLRRMALKQGSLQYPVLEPLVPSPLPDAQTCPTCGGSGTIGSNNSKVICECGGVGWIVPGEDRGESPG